MVKTSAPLQIRLTEPVIFLRGPSTGLDARGRPQVVRNDGQPAMLRGLLTLRLGKPTRIRSISIQFTGKARTEWPEGIGLRRMDTHEEHILLSESVIFFSSRDRTASRSRSTRRAASLGPGITLSQWDLNDEDLDDNIVLHGVPDENAEMSDWVAVSRRDRDDAFRSSSTMSGRRGSLPRHPDSFPMRPNSLDRANVSPMDESPALGTLERGDLNASPAYTPHVEPHPVQPRQSSLRQSSSPMPLTESGLSPIVSAAPSRAGSDSDESAEVGPRRLDPIQRNISLRQGLVEPYSSRLPQMDDFAVEDEDALHPDSRTNDVPTGNRAASIRTMHSAFSVSSTSISTPPHEHTSGGNHPTVTPVQNASAESPEIDSPVLPPGVLHRDRATHDDLPGSSPFRSSTNDRVLPDNDLNLVAPVNGSSRRSSLLSRDSARVSWETAAGPSPIRSSSDLPEVRPGRKSRLGNDSRIVSHNNSVPGPSTHRPFVPGPYSQDSEPPRRSNSGTNSLATRESNRGTSMEANRESSEDGRDRRASRFSLSAALRGLNKGRMSSKSQTRGDESRTYSLNEASPPNPSVNIPTARRMSGLAIPTRLLRGGRNGRQTRSESVGQADDFVASYGRDEARGRSQSRGSLAEAKEETLENHGRGRNKGMKVLTGALGLSMNHFENREEPDNWKEFRKGTYNYPISFPIPVDAPPTIHAEFGSVIYRLKATVVRAGGLTSNLVEDQEVFMIASPQEDDLEESENIIVERQWEEQLRYQLVLSGKAFPIGGTIPISIRLMPLMKCKIHRLSIGLEEKSDYFAQDRKVARHETPKKFLMLFIKQIDRLERIQPLLPIISDAPNAARDSPLAPLALQAALNNPTTESFDVDGLDDNMYATLLDPMGPWHLEHNLTVPDCVSAIRFSTKHEKTNISIGHVLKIIIRTERGDDMALDVKGRRKHFDIIIETPVKILDCRVNPQWNSLPTYTANNTGASSVKGNVCSVHGRKQGAPLVPSNRASLQAGDPLVSASASPHHVVGLPPFDIRDLSTSRSRDGRLSEVLSPRGREGRGNAEDTLLERNIVYDRLMSGQATETGEIPPSYGEAVASAARARSASRMGRGTQCEGEAERADGEESGNRSRSRLRQSVVAEGR